MVVVPLAEWERVAGLTRHADSGMAWWLLRPDGDSDAIDLTTVLGEIVAGTSKPGSSVWVGRVAGSPSALRYAADVTLAASGDGRWRAAGGAAVVGALTDAEVACLLDASTTVAITLELVRTGTDRSAEMLAALLAGAATLPWGSDAVVVRTEAAAWAVVGRPSGSMPIRAAGLRPLSIPETVPPPPPARAMPRRALVMVTLGVVIGLLAVAGGLAADRLTPPRTAVRGPSAPRAKPAPGEQRPVPSAAAPAIVEVPRPGTNAAAFVLPPGSPVFVDHALGQPFGVDPEHPAHMAYCSADAIQVTANAGGSWLTVPVTTAITMSRHTAQPIASHTSPVCYQALVDPISASTVYAIFKSFGPDGLSGPTQSGYVTIDLGRTWQAVPPPSGRAPTDFAGFRLTAGHVVAIFGVPQVDAPFGTATLSETVERSLDGGRRWVASSLPCPFAGPCLRLGGAADPGCARYAAPNLIELSYDGGHHNGLSGWAGFLDGCSAGELVTFSSGAALRLGSFERDTAAVSYDGGAVWHDLSVPGPPGFDNGSVSYGPITLLTTGALLTQSASGWDLLPPRAARWCPIAGEAMAALAGPVQFIGDRLWSFAADPSGDAQAPLLQATTPVSVPISALHC